MPTVLFWALYFKHYQKVEDEFHYPCRCVVFRQERPILFSNIEKQNNEFTGMSDEEKIVY